MSDGSRIPLARYAVARLLVLLAYLALPRGSNADWPRERLWWVNGSLKMSMNRLRGKMEKPGA